MTSSESTPGDLILGTSKQPKNFLLSPTTTAWLNSGSAVLISFSMSTGATFYPPAVIINYFILPVIESTPFGPTSPTSPEWTNPLASTVSFVSFSFL